VPSDDWRRGPSRAALGPGEVHVWRAPLLHPADRLAAFHALLSDAERERAARFRFPVHRDRFIAGRGIQRDVLSRYLGIPPAALRYRETAHGKPLLEPAPSLIDLRFNVSNAGDLALYAVTLGREVGVDLEQVKTMPDARGVAERFFSATEVAFLQGLPPQEVEPAFFRCWTRKEAYVKAIGEGLSMPLHQFDVAYARGEPARILRTRPDPAHAGRWAMESLEPGPGYVGALVVEAGGTTLTRFGWTPVEG
jgi:4'-phosphopantetheinyl transferase